MDKMSYSTAELSKLLQMSKKSIDGLSYAIQTSVKIDPRNYYGNMSFEYVMMLLELISDKMSPEQTLEDFLSKKADYYFGEVRSDTICTMRSYIISFTADYEEYMLSLSFSMPFSDEESANEFAENDVSHIVVSENGISVISNSENMELCGDYVFKRLNDGSHSKVLLCESDYQFIEKNSREVFDEMCGKYGNREYFVFSISAFSVNFGVILGKSGSGREWSERRSDCKIGCYYK